MSFESEWNNPPREFSLLPFWFWNDELDADEIRRQIAEFDANGVYGFVIHPRVGLPRDCGWMSEKLLGFYHVAIDEAVRRDMRVILYDEGMYPSGSSCGQVVAKHPDLACRGLALHSAVGDLPPGSVVLQTFTDVDGTTKHVVDRPIDAYIRGLHYTTNDFANGVELPADPPEDEPPAGDILNPRTAAAVIDLVYARFFKEFGHHFGKTVLGIFTDEPNPTGKCREKNVFPGTTGIVEHVSRFLGYDAAAHLPKLWQIGDEASKFRNDYRHAVRQRMDETWYAPLSQWCEAHGVTLCGHPDTGDEIGVQKYFQIPGQDLVWRWVAPDHSSALEGPESTQGKCSASAMVHHGRRRNSNEFAGAYGPETTFDEIKWLANWCLIRGVNLLIPHAFYYSVRGPRRHERPPQIGPHTPQWNDFGPDGFKAFADHCRRLCWLNTDSTPRVDVAILTHADRCPWPAAKALLTRQIDFHYLDPDTLLAHAKVDGRALAVRDMRYTVVVIDGDDDLPADIQAVLAPLVSGGSVVRFTATAPAPGRLPTAASADALSDAVHARLPAMFETSASGGTLRVRAVKKHDRTVVIVFNESLSAPAAVPIAASGQPPLVFREMGHVTRASTPADMVNPANLVYALINS